MKKKVFIYTDGACIGNPGPGGWGALIFYNGYERELYGGELESTNNRMELKAAIEALNVLKESCIVYIHTDSVYVSKGISEWVKEWKKNGWKTTKKKPVKNGELWQQLDLACRRHKVVWRWIKGHVGILENERVDILARKGAGKFLKISSQNIADVGGALDRT